MDVGGHGVDRIGRRIALGVIGLAAVASLVPLAVSGGGGGTTDEQIASALERHPEYVAKALQVHLQRQQRDQQDATTASALPVVRTILKGDPSIPKLGPVGAADVVEFFDYNCGYCKVFAQQTAEPMVAKGRIRLHLVQAPILGEGSQRLAEFAAAAQIQGRFPAAHAYLLKQHARTVAEAEALRAGLIAATGLDGARFAKSLTDGSAKKLVLHSFDLATKAKLQGTPLIYAGGQIVAGAVDQARLETMIRR
jgi:protein-disulfide isomerase